VQSISEIKTELGNIGQLNGSKGARLGISGMISVLCGGGTYEGYEIKTSEHTYLMLISNETCCCESWGYFTSDDSIDEYVGKTLIDVALTDKALNTLEVEESGYYDDCGGIQFVNFKFADGSVLQFAVYNAHNGYYGHPIIFAKDEEIFLSDTL
jgi:hypothetical protein